MNERRDDVPYMRGRIVTGDIQVDEQDYAVRDALVEQIAARLAGSLDDAALARWAFDFFYASELDSHDDDDDDDDDHRAAAPLTDALDALMFGDDPHFHLDEVELRALAERLKAL